MKTTILYNKNLKWQWITDKAIVILPSDELLNKYNLIPPVNIDNIISGIESGLLWWNDFGGCYNGKNALTGMTMVTKRIKTTKIENIDYNKYDETFIEDCLRRVMLCEHGKVFGYIIIDFVTDGEISEEGIFVRFNKKHVTINE